jgi:hypothetical protein
MAKDYTSLLGKNSTSSWSDIAASVIQNQGKDSKRNRNILLASLFFNAKEASMKNNVLKNLQENDKQKTYELAGLTDKYEKYNQLIETDKAYKQDPFYFQGIAEAEFVKKNQDYFKKMGDTADSRKQREDSITELAKTLENLHKEKLTLEDGAMITPENYMSKEEFFKPFEDYYSQKANSIAAPKNLSLVHKGWNKLTQGFSKPLAIQESKAAKENRNRTVYDYLLEPEELTAAQQIERYRDPNLFTYTEDEALVFLSDNIQPNDPARRKILSDLQTSKKTAWTTDELETHIVVSQADFNPIIEKNNQVINAFNDEWSKRNENGTQRPIPEVGTPEYMDYYFERENVIDEANGTGDAKTRQLRRNIFELADLEKIINSSGRADTHPLLPVKTKLENDIKASGIDAVKFEMYKMVSNRLADPFKGPAIQKQIAEYATKEEQQEEGKTWQYATLGEYYETAVNDLMTGFNQVFGN